MPKSSSLNVLNKHGSECTDKGIPLHAEVCNSVTSVYMNQSGIQVPSSTKSTGSQVTTQALAQEIVSEHVLIGISGVTTKTCYTLKTQNMGHQGTLGFAVAMC
jgi:hypothetical protein